MPATAETKLHGTTPDGHRRPAKAEASCPARTSSGRLDSAEGKATGTGRCLRGAHRCCRRVTASEAKTTGCPDGLGHPRMGITTVSVTCAHLCCSALIKYGSAWASLLASFITLETAVANW